MTTIADDYKSRFIQGQIDTIKEAKETSPGMLNFLSVPEEKDVFMYPEQIGIDYKNLYGEPRSCLLYTSPSPRDRTRSRMPSSA